MEEWRKIPGYETYEVSNTGKVRTNNWMNHGVQKEMSPSIWNKSYQVNLFKDGKQKCMRVHRLVAMAFIPNPENKPEINHIDGNRLNNIVSNLEWCTRAENLAHEHRTNLGDNAKEGLRKCSIAKRKAVIAYFKDGTTKEYESIQEAGRQLGIDPSKICACAKRRVYKQTHGIVFRYKEEQ